MRLEFSPIDAEAIQTIWPIIEPMLSPAIAYDENQDTAEVYERLMSGNYGATIVNSEKAWGIVVSEVCDLEGVRVCWVCYLGGENNLPPKQWLTFMRECLSYLEELAARLGCEEIHLGGRDWSRIFPDYKFTGGRMNDMKKVLYHG